MPGDFPLAIGVGAIPEGAAVYAAGAARGSLENAGVRFPPYQALLIGQTYEGNEELELAGCREDAKTMAAILAASDMVRYDPERITMLDDASGGEIVSALTALAEGADERTVTIFYYSGHGGKDGYLIGYNKSSQTYDRIRPSTLAAKLAAIPGTKIVLIDACYSGSLIGRGAEAVPERFAEAFLSAFREPAARSGELKKTGIHVLVAARRNQESQSIGIGKNWFGLFTAYLQEALCGAQEGLRHLRWYEWYPKDASEALRKGSRLPADADGDRMVTLGEAYRYVADGTGRFIRRWNGMQDDPKKRLDQNVQIWPDDSDAVLFGR